MMHQADHSYFINNEIILAVTNINGNCQYQPSHLIQGLSHNLEDNQFILGNKLKYYTCLPKEFKHLEAFVTGVPFHCCKSI